MRVRLLGVHNVESSEERLAGSVVDGALALDAGSLTRSLTRPEQERVRHILLSHRHYDHIRDVPALAYGTRDAGTLHVYGLPQTLEALTSHLLNDVVYSAYHARRAADGSPRVSLHPMAPGVRVEVAGYEVTPLPAFHTCPAVGFLVRAGDASLYYTGDTGPGFATALAAAPPDLLLAEATYGSVFRQDALDAGHLTPALLREEIEQLIRQAGWRPRVTVLHMNPAHEAAIEREMAEVRHETGWDVIIGRAGLEMEVRRGR
jgi:Cft2 family RNA processing exonuclease